MVRRRTNDTKGLGDYDVNKKKLRHGLKGLAKINKLVLSSVYGWNQKAYSVDSSIFEQHPEYAISLNVSNLPWPSSISDEFSKRSARLSNQ